jgi:hypothetical protein
LTGKLEQIVELRPVTRQLSTHPGVGPLTALAFELVIGIWQISTRAKWRSARSGCCRVLESVLTSPTLLEMGIFQQLAVGHALVD